jgi:hypothetical protein
MKASVNQSLQCLAVKLREEDKIKHMVWSFWLTLGALIVLSPALAFGAVFLLGLAKEWWDKYYGSGFCFYDITGNLIGSLAGLLCAYVLRLLLSPLFNIS